MDTSKPHRSCPKTGGRPVSMTRQGWDKVCAAAKAEAEDEFRGWKGANRNAGRLFISACMTCSGEIPAEVTIIELSQLNIKQEDVMGNAKRIQGNCDLCGETKMVMTIHGKTTCTMCENLRMSIRKRPVIVVEALKELAPQALPAGSVDDTELRKLRVRIEELTSQSNEQEALLERSLNELEAEKMEANQLRLDLNEVERTLDATRAANRRLEDELAQTVVGISSEILDIAADCRPALTDLALRLAIGTMKGEIEGVDAEDIQLLRSI